MKVLVPHEKSAFNLWIEEMKEIFPQNFWVLECWNKKAPDGFENILPEKERVKI